MILFLHNRYRTTGGEERVVERLLELVREQLGEPAQLLARDSASLSPARAAAALLGGGLAPKDITDAVRLSGARVVHAHNLNPAFGWRALLAARRAGARVVLHLHQYRLVCANGVCFTRGSDCTRCHGRNTLPGIALGCRGPRSEALAYGAALALWQRRTAELADAVVVPSEFARERLRELGAPLDFNRVYVLAPPVEIPSLTAPLKQAERSSDSTDGDSTDGTSGAADVGSSRDRARSRLCSGDYALVVSRLSQEKGVDVAIDACRLAGVPLVIAGEGPQRAALQARARNDPVTFAGRVDDGELARLRAGAGVALVPSRSAETFGMAAAEAMAAGLPVVCSRVGALSELVAEPQSLVPAGDPVALAAAMSGRIGDRAAGDRGRRRVFELCAPEAVARRLAQIYDATLRLPHT
jgi:glycosyltransferase involved in cell wall biosynthesis